MERKSRRGAEGEEVGFRKLIGANGIEQSLRGRHPYLPGTRCLRKRL